MRRFAALILFSLICYEATAQTVSPPITSDEFGWLRWAIAVLLGVVVSVSGAFVALMNTRVTDKDKEITRLAEQLKLEQDKSKELQGKLDALHKDMQEKVIPALTTTADLIRTFIKGS